MNEEPLSGLGMFLIHRGMDHIPESEVIYQVKRNWHEWPNLVSYLTEFHVYNYTAIDWWRYFRRKLIHLEINLDLSDQIVMYQ